MGGSRSDAGRRVDEVAALFGLTATYVSMLRGRARAQGSAGLVRRRGRPRKLSDRQVSQARVWSGQGQTQQVIADRLGVAQSVISDLLARLAPVPVQEPLPATDATEPADGTVPPGSVMAAPPTAVYFPACIGTMFGPPDGASGVSSAFAELCERAGASIHIRQCAQPR